MPNQEHTIEDAQGRRYRVIVQRDKRLKKSARWNREDEETIRLRIPYALPNRQIGSLLQDIASSLNRKRRKRTSRTDADLQRRAEYINEHHFQGAISWTAIRWVNNMQQRLGSCTNGGETDGHIRISERIKTWPQWVIDYVIAHELAHRVHDNHSKAFWDYLTQAYPLTERARGFIEGAAFEKGQMFDQDAL